MGEVVQHNFACLPVVRLPGDVAGGRRRNERSGQLVAGKQGAQVRLDEAGSASRMTECMSEKRSASVDFGDVDVGQCRRW